jgi:hypothetical protein
MIQLEPSKNIRKSQGYNVLTLQLSPSDRRGSLGRVVSPSISDREPE